MICMKKKLVPIFAFVLLTAFGLTSCNRAEDQGQSGSQGQAASGSSSASAEPIPDPGSSVQDIVSELDASTPAVMTPNFTDLSKLSGKKNGWGQGTQVDENNRPTSCTQFQEKYGQYDAVFIKENNQDVYLTFDEGYENGFTAKILDVLKEKKAPAVFFVTYDYVKRNPDLIKRMIAEGHVVGNHSYNHPSMPSVSLEKAAEEITKLHEYVKENFGYTMTLFRPPMGEYSEQTLALTKELGYQTVFWSFAYKDWDPKNQPEEEKSLQKTVDACHGGAVYLLHAVSETNTNILGRFIDGVREKGFVFKALE